MRNNPIDDRRIIDPLCVTGPEAKTDFETGEIKIDKRSGMKIWVTGVAARTPGERKATVIDVSVIANEPPPVKVGDVVRFVDLECALWEQNGRAGLTYRAAAIMPAGAAPTSAPAAVPGANGAPSTLSAPPTRPGTKSGSES